MEERPAVREADARDGAALHASCSVALDSRAAEYTTALHPTTHTWKGAVLGIQLRGRLQPARDSVGAQLQAIGRGGACEEGRRRHCGGRRGRRRARGRRAAAGARRRRAAGCRGSTTCAAAQQHVQRLSELLVGIALGHAAALLVHGLCRAQQRPNGASQGASHAGGSPQPQQVDSGV